MVIHLCLDPELGRSESVNRTNRARCTSDGDRFSRRYMGARGLEKGSGYRTGYHDMMT